MLGEIGLMHVELLPEIVPSLINVLSDGTPAVARQAITSGIHLFRCVLEKVSIQVILYVERYLMLSNGVFDSTAQVTFL